MIRSQIYLTEEERCALGRLAKATGRTQSDLIREAIDRYLETRLRDGRLARLRLGKGMWADREDVPDVVALRREFER